MAKIHRISFYAINANENSDLSAYDVEACLESAPYFRDCIFHQVHAENSDAFEWDDNDPINYKNCDLAHLAKHFIPNADEPDAKQIKIGGFYRHFKGKLVHVIAVSRHSETQELLVVYSCDNGTGTWCRPLSMFLSDVDADKYPEYAGKKRFEYCFGGE